MKRSIMGCAKGLRSVCTSTQAYQVFSLHCKESAEFIYFLYEQEHSSEWMTTQADQDLQFT